MTCCRYPSESECSAWDAWTNPAAEANDPISLVSEYAACGVWRPHMALPFSRMSLVAYLRGWVSVYWLCAVCAVSLRDCWAYASGGEGKRRKGCAGVFCISRHVPDHVETTADWVTAMRCCGAQRSDGTLARIVDVLGVAAPHGPGVVWYATRRVNAQM
ncbi:hypothetical protein TGCAST_389940, partial [Toxoplasma gondii CAST]